MDTHVFPGSRIDPTSGVRWRHCNDCRRSHIFTTSTTVEGAHQTGPQGTENAVSRAPSTAADSRSNAPQGERPG